MQRTILLVVFCVLLFPPVASANGAKTRTEPVQAAPRTPLVVVVRPNGFVLRQDLFDRNDPNNLRSNYPGPPAQPGQY